MKLNENAFEQIKNGKKIYEARVNDEKRREMNIGDTITFSKLPDLTEKVEVVITDIVKANSFEELFTLISPTLAGWKEGSSPSKCSNDLEKYYSKEEQEKYGVVGIEIMLGEEIS